MATENDSAEESSIVKSKLVLLILIFEFIGLILSFSDKLQKLNDSISKNYYLIASVIFISCLVFNYYTQFPRRSKKLKPLLYALIVLIFLGSVIYNYWETRCRKTKHSDYITIRLPSHNEVSPQLADPTDQAEKKTDKTKSTFKIREFYIDQELCSYQESIENDYLAGPPAQPHKYRSFNLDPDVKIDFQNGNCIGSDGNALNKKILQLLQAKLKKDEKAELLEYLKTEEDISRIITKRDDIFAKVMFTQSEIEKMKIDNPVDYEVVREWIIKCIGIYEPVFTFNIKNLTNKNIKITTITYEILNVGTVLGGDSGPLYPLITYNHLLKFERGDQPFQLHHPLLVKSDDEIAFNLRIIPISKAIGQTYKLRIKITDADRNSQSTETFQLVLNK